MGELILYPQLDKFINRTRSEVYLQPSSDGHDRAMRHAIEQLIDPNHTKPFSVLDVGCGHCEAMEEFKKRGCEVTGVNMGADYDFCKKERPSYNVQHADMHFMGFGDNTFDVVFARHVAEHSFMPAYLLSEFYRITKEWCLVIVPPPEIGVEGDNHYSVLQKQLWEKLMKYVGFEIVKVVDSCTDCIEMRFLLRKVK